MRVFATIYAIFLIINYISFKPHIGIVLISKRNLIDIKKSKLTNYLMFEATNVRVRFHF